MKSALKISFLSNLALLSGLTFLLLHRPKQIASPVPATRKAKPAVSMTIQNGTIVPVTPFRWSQLGATNNYRKFVANLRAIGCPEKSVEDIVRGDTARVFSWERKHLGLDGFGTGPWSRVREQQLVTSLLGENQSIASVTQNVNNSKTARTSEAVVQAALPSRNAKNSQSAQVATPSYPLFLQNVNWKALGFSAGQEAAIAQVRQQFQSETSGLNLSPAEARSQNAGSPNANGVTANPANPTGSAALTQWRKAVQNANNQLRDALGAQGYLAYQEQQYYAWYRAQVLAASAKAEHLTINPEEFSRLPSMTQ